MLLFLVAYILVVYLSRLLLPLQPLMVGLITVTIILMLILIIMGQVVRRYHDFGYTGWVPGVCAGITILMTLVETRPETSLQRFISPEAFTVFQMLWSALSLMILFFLPALIPGQKHRNRYGEDPRFL